MLASVSYEIPISYKTVPLSMPQLIYKAYNDKEYIYKITYSTNFKYIEKFLIYSKNLLNYAQNNIDPAS